MLPLLRPPYLPAGATIGVIAPANSLRPAREGHYRAAVDLLRGMGFQIREGRALRTQRWWSSGTPAAQAEDIHQMFADPSVAALVAVAGGASAMHVVDLLDYELIRQNPKPFMGMSDITTYHWAMWTQAGLVGFQANSLTAGWSEWYQATGEPQRLALVDLYRRLLSRPEPLGRLPELSSWQTWRAGAAEGMLLGGLLRRFVALAGTRYFPPLEAFDGAILFWEEVDQPLPDLALSLATLRHLGILDRIGGMLIGKVWLPPDSVAPEHPSLRELVLELLGDRQIPVLAELDFGHHISMLPLPIGVTARVDSGQRLLELTGAATSARGVEEE